MVAGSRAQIPRWEMIFDYKQVGGKAVGGGTSQWQDDWILKGGTDLNMFLVYV